MLDIMQKAAIHDEKSSHGDMDYLARVTTASYQSLPDLASAMVSAELDRQKSRTEEEKYQSALEEMEDDLSLNFEGSPV